MRTWKTTEERDMKRLQGKWTTFWKGMERESFFYLQVMWKWFSFLPLWTWIIIDRVVWGKKRKKQQHGNLSRDNTCLNLLNLTLDSYLVFHAFSKGRSSDKQELWLNWVKFILALMLQHKINLCGAAQDIDFFFFFFSKSEYSYHSDTERCASMIPANIYSANHTCLASRLGVLLV